MMDKKIINPSLTDEEKKEIEKIMSFSGLSRQENEEFENYKMRRKMEKILNKYELKGKVIWDSKKQGTRRGKFF